MSHQALLLVLVLVLLVAAVSAIAERTRFPSPILMLGVGAVLAFVPGVPAVRLDPELVLLVLLPPLLYSSGVDMSWRGFRSSLRPILLLAVGCVLFTAISVAAMMHEFVHVPWTVGFILGAIVSPPDVVAAMAFLSTTRLPRRVVTILEGESLANDATALVILGFAIQALTTGHFSLPSATIRLLAIVFGEVAFGVALGWLTLRARHLARAPRSEVLLALATPFLAFWPAHAVGGSGVIACAAAGLYVSRNGRRLIPPNTRLQGYFIWDLVVWATESLIFLLGGLEARQVWDAMVSIGWPHALAVGSLTALTVVVVRFIWVYPAAYLPRLFPGLRRSEPRPNWRVLFFIAIAGIRGVDNLVAALLVPGVVNGRPIAERNLILFGTFIVMGVTLFLLGGSLPSLARILGLSRLGTEEAETNKRYERQVRVQGIEAALKHLRQRDENVGTCAASGLSRNYDERRRALSEGARTGANDEPTRATAQLERQLLEIERESAGRAYDENRLTDEARRRIEREMDLEEARIANREADRAQLS